MEAKYSDGCIYPCTICRCQNCWPGGTAWESAACANNDSLKRSVPSTRNANPCSAGASPPSLRKGNNRGVPLNHSGH